MLLVLCGVPSGARAQEAPLLRIETHGTEEEAEGALDRLDASRIPTGLLHDRVIDLVDVERFDGKPLSRIATLDSVRQLHHQLVRSAVRAEARRRLPDLQTLTRNAEPYVRAEVVPLGVTSVRYDRIKRDAPAGKNLPREEQTQRALQTGEAPSYETHLAFAAAPFKRQSYDHTVRFVIPPELYVVNHAHRATRFEVDFGDGQGRRSLAPGEVVTVRYTTGGRKTIRVTAFEGAEAHHAVTAFAVAEAAVPAPDESWLDRTARRPYAGGYASYDAHIFYGAGNTRLTNPVVFVEGFDAYYSDPVKRRTWQDMYLIVAEEGVADTLRARGYDLVLMKLHNAAGYIQRNAYALVNLLQNLNAALPEGREIVVVGPSMGGLIGRYALSYMERVGRPHNVRLSVSIDTPHRGGNIPLGDQFFLEFFDSDSDKAQEGTLALNTVAARQQLIYHYRSYPGTDPLRKELMRQLAVLGHPHIRMVTLADGSGNGLAQRGNERVGFRRMQPGDKIVEYRYRSFLIDLDGDVWAVPDTADGWTQIFEGRKDVIGPHYRSQNVYVRGTLPLDNAPGGIRPTQQEIAGGDTPYGRIYTSFPEHAWIPTVSALDLGDVHPFYDLQSDPQHLLTTDAAGKTSTSTFEAVFYPADNETHVKANTTNAAFLLAQIGPVPEPLLAVAPPMLEANVEGQAVVLRWQGADGAPGERFAIEQRTGDGRFVPLHTVARGDAEAGAQTYQYRVENAQAGRQTFRLKQIREEGVVYSAEVAVTVALPEGYALSPAFPNPFNPQTRFTLSVASPQDVQVAVFNTLGQRVAVLHDGLLEAGTTHQLAFDASAFSSGVYLLRATGEVFSATRTMTLLK